jgi:hypothetical protein
MPSNSAWSMAVRTYARDKHQMQALSAARSIPHVCRQAQRSCHRRQHAHVAEVEPLHFVALAALDSTVHHACTKGHQAAVPQLHPARDVGPHGSPVDVLLMDDELSQCSPGTRGRHLQWHLHSSPRTQHLHTFELCRLPGYAFAFECAQGHRQLPLWLRHEMHLRTPFSCCVWVRLRSFAVEK